MQGGPLFGQSRERPCPQCGGEVTYGYGTWSCGTCEWNSARHTALGRCTEERCPECGGTIVYNGNYFCEFFDNGCNWGLPEMPRKEADRDLYFWLLGVKPR